MKQKMIVFFILGFILVVVLSFLSINYAQNFAPIDESGGFSKERAMVAKNSNTKTNLKIERVSKTAILPYWNIPKKEELGEYEKLLYFGISPEISGSILDDEGLQELYKFTSQNYLQKKGLVVKMLNNKTNTVLLEDPKTADIFQNKAIELAKTSGFDYIALDLEVSSLPFEGVSDSITLFVKNFSQKADQIGLEFEIILYGDLFKRGRPYDLKQFADVVDGVAIMAYDFHKSRGEPGPNFPFDAESSFPGKKTSYTYSFKEMIDDFLLIVGPEKLTVIFGMYGYDWALGPQGLPLKKATAISLKVIEKEILPRCGSENSLKNRPDTGNFVTGESKYQLCVLQKDTVSQEKRLQYSDIDGYRHELWFEDKESAEFKIAYLKEKGIGKVSYWVWGYY